MMDYPLTLPAILERAGEYFGQTEIVSRLDRSLHRETFSDLRLRARKLAKCLTSAGLKRGERVATLMWNHYIHLEQYFGIPAAGGVLHPLNLRLHPDEIAYIIRHAQDRFLIVDDVLLPVFEKLKSQVQAVEANISNATARLNMYSQKIVVQHAANQNDAARLQEAQREQWQQQALADDQAMQAAAQKILAPTY